MSTLAHKNKRHRLQTYIKGSDKKNTNTFSTLTNVKYYYRNYHSANFFWKMLASIKLTQEQLELEHACKHVYV